MNILFIGSIYSERFLEVLKQNNLPVSSAGQTFQKALLTGLSSNCDVKVINEFFVPSFPQFKKGIILSEQIVLKGTNISGESISFLNLPFIKKFSQLISYTLKVKKFANWADVIIVYEATSRQLLASIIAGFKKPKIVIVPDLPEFMSDNKNPLYLAAKKIDRMLIDFALKRYNGFVLLSKFMTEKIKIADRPWMLMEGIFNMKELVDNLGKEKPKIVLYTGKIEKWFGIEDLLKAFCLVKGDDCRLWLCGPGDIDLVTKYNNIDSRIQYLGCLSHEDVLKYQKKATILVNPRHSSDEFTLYSFPSKTMEYMASGTPTLMCKLKSLPTEYLKHLYIFEDETIEGMAQAIQKCLDLPEEERAEFGRKAADFIIYHKDAVTQAKRLIEFANIISK